MVIIVIIIGALVMNYALVKNLRASVGKEPGCPGRISERAVSGKAGMPC